MSFQTIAQMQVALRNKQISATELCQEAMNKAQQGQNNLNCMITIAPERAQQQAEQADAVLANGESIPPLCGIPIAHKDLFCTEGLTTTCGSKMLANFVSPYSATLVKRIDQQNAVTIGKTNMDEFAMGSTNATSYFGKVKNPWHLNKIPGGSSGGSAAAVAARIIPAATASDTGGSIRQPAALCGVTGIKPTYGRVSRYGMVAFASSLDQAGVIATTAEDCSFLLEVMMGHDPNDATSSRQPTTKLSNQLDSSLRGKKIGIATDYFDDRLQPSTQKIIQSAIAEFEKAGASLCDIQLPNSRYSVPVYYTLAPAECSSNLSRFDGIRFGHRATETQDYEQLISQSRSEGFGDEVKRRILVGTYVLSAAYFDAYYKKALQIRELIKQDFTKALQSCDFIVAPTCPGIATDFDDQSIQGTAMYYQDTYTISSNLAGLPAMSIPCGQVDGLPVGLQLIGNHFEESTILAAAHQIQLATDWHLQQPQHIS